MISDKETIANCLSTIKELESRNTEHDKAVRELLKFMEVSMIPRVYPSTDKLKREALIIVAAVREFYLEEKS